MVLFGKTKVLHYNLVLDMARFEKGKKYEVVDAQHGECIGCCFNKDGCTLDIDIPCRKEFIYKEIKESDNERT